MYTQTSMLLCDTHENERGPESPGAIKLDMDTKKKKKKKKNIKRKEKKYKIQAVFSVKKTHTS